MQYLESIWYRDIIEKHINNNSLILNIGSSTKNFRENIQPHINDNIYVPLQQKNCKIINVDLKQDEGIDFAGDITDPAFLETLKKINPDFILCSNLLEHITEKKVFINSLRTILKNGSYLILSVPHSYPYHPDPIDTLYRPSLQELEKDLPDFTLVSGRVVKCGMLYDSWYINYKPILRPVLLLMKMLKSILMFKSRDKMLIKWLFVESSVTCGLFKCLGEI